MDLKIKDLKELIITCAKNGVSDFSWGDLSIQFGGAKVETFEEVETPQEIVKVQEEIHNKILEHEKIKTDIERTSDLIINNPLEFEESLFSGVVETEESEDEGI